MSRAYIVYEMASGRITKIVVCPPDMIDIQLGAGEAYIEGSCDDSAFYVDLASLSTRPKRDFALSALPLPCVVRIEGVEYRCTTQPQFEFDVPGTYQIEVDAGPRFHKKAFTYAYPPRSR